MLYEINEKAIKLENEGKKIIKLNIGDPDLETPHEIVEAAYGAMKKGKTKYSSAYGEKNLREKLARVHGVSAKNVVITPGSKWGVFATMNLLLKDGGNVVIPTPYWTAYGLSAKAIGAEIRLLKTKMESKWRVDLEAFERLIDKNTRMVILNNPNNPTSKVMDDDRINGIVQIANEKRISVLSDEVYSDISFVETRSILDCEGDHVMVTGFSKMFNMTGWRIGYVVANREFIDRIAKLNQITFSNVPVFIQEAALKALEMHDELTKEIKSEYQKRANVACETLAKSGLEFTKPDAPFYVFPRRRGLDSERFALDLLDKGVAVAPGSSFGDYREHFRISLTAPRNDIATALDRICEAIG